MNIGSQEPQNQAVSRRKIKPLWWPKTRDPTVAEVVVASAGVFCKSSAEVYSSGSPRSKIRSALRAEWTRTKAFKKSMHNKPTNKERKYGKFTLQGNIAHNWMLQSKNRKIKVQREATSSSSGCLSSLGTQQSQRWLWPQQVFFAKVLLKFTVVALLGAKSDPHWGRNGREPKRSKNPCTTNLRIKRGSMGNSLCKET